jgi:diguanylate cyclase
MTGLYNIEFFYEELDRRINEYQRCKGEQFLSVVIFDIDHFAQFSLDHGVPTANLIICDVARRLNKIARKMDIPFRYAGSSFVAILPKCRLSGAVIFADRVRLNVAGEPIETESELFQVTISCGCAEFVPGESAANLIARTESALNRARAQGCNVVCVSEESHEKAIDETVG